MRGLTRGDVVRVFFLSPFFPHDSHFKVWILVGESDDSEPTDFQCSAQYRGREVEGRLGGTKSVYRDERMIRFVGGCWCVYMCICVCVCLSGAMNVQGERGRHTIRLRYLTYVITRRRFPWVSDGNLCQCRQSRAGFVWASSRDERRNKKRSAEP